MEASQNSKIEQFIRNETTLFQGLSDGALEVMIEKLKPRKIALGETLVKQGDIGDTLFIVTQGAFEAWVKTNGDEPKKLGGVGRGEVVGEGSLITKEPRNATVLATRDSGVLCLSHTDFQEILEAYPGEFKSFVELVSKRSRSVHPGHFRPDHAYLSKFLSSIDLLASVDQKTLEAIAPKVKWVFLPGGEKLMSQGDIGKSMYMVVNGRLRFIVQSEAGEQVAEGEFTRGDIIGEMAVLTGEKRSATVYSLRACELVRLSGATFEILLKSNPEAMFKITKTIAKRLLEKQAQGDRKNKKSVGIITLFPIQGQPLAKGTCLNIKSSLEKLGKTVTIARRSDFMEHYKKLKGAKADSENYDLAQAASWLYEIEKNSDLVILHTDFDDPVWSDIVIHHTDRILLVGRGLGSPKLSPDEIRYLGALDERFSPGRELVLLYSPEEAPLNCEEWLRDRSVNTIHHVRPFQEGGFDRLARFLTGRSIGVALGGGGAKGMAHIGLLRAFEEEGIPVDAIGGTSAGSIIGSIYAMGYTWREVMDKTLGLLKGDEALKDYGFPTMSLIRGKKYTAILKGFFKERRIEDLWIPFFGVATDLTKTRKKVINKGEIWKAVRASSSLPGIFPPLYEGGSLLVDGALLDNVPGSVVKTTGAGRSIAVSLNSSSEHKTDTVCSTLYEDSGAGVAPRWFGIWRRLKKKRGALDGVTLGAIVMRSTMVNSEAMAQKTRKEVDLYIELPVDKFGIFSFDNAEEIAEAGYHYAKAHIGEWKEKLGLE